MPGPAEWGEHGVGRVDGTNTEAKNSPGDFGEIIAIGDIRGRGNRFGNRLRDGAILGIWLVIHLDALHGYRILKHCLYLRSV